MTNEPTPETDALENSLVALDAKYPPSDNASFVKLCTEQLIAKCRALEIQRNAARAERDALSEALERNCVQYVQKQQAIIAERDALRADAARLRAALDLIAAPMRPDGTYNRDRTACGIIARAALAALAQ
jgi:seryl-tRNA synthetase